MADKVIDIATLGSREVEYYQTEGVVDPKSGMRTLQEVKKKRVEPQPVLTPEEAAGLLRLKVSTLYRHVSEGRYSGAVKRGKPLRFWRNRLVEEFMR